MMRFGFKQKIDAANLVVEITDKVYDRLHQGLYVNIHNEPEPMTKAQINVELQVIIDELLAELRSKASALKTIGPEHLSGEKIRNTIFGSSTPQNAVWRELHNTICNFLIEHTISGEHVQIPERATLILETIFDILRSKMNVPAVATSSEKPYTGKS